jgi:hypothetical protein
MSRTSVCIASAWALLTGLVVGWLVGLDLGVTVGERRTIACTLFCQRAAAQEYGVVDLDSCTCYGNVRELVDQLDHVDTGFHQPPAVGAL